jgi:hypothetical protein
MGICKHCQIEFDVSDKPLNWMANHSRWCLSNPKRDSYKETFKITNKGGSNGRIVSSEVREKLSKSVKKAHFEGKYDYSEMGHFKGKRHSEETKQKIREKALSSNHRRLKRKMVEYNGVWLDSTWELELAKRLDEIDVVWIRPNPIQWEDEEGQKHHYFPDFYLPDYNLYLDPKNPEALKRQRKKMEILLKQISNLLVIESLSDCQNFAPLRGAKH